MFRTQHHKLAFTNNHNKKCTRTVTQYIHFPTCL